MNASVVIAIIEGIVQQVPAIITAYQNWVSIVNSGQDPTAAQLKLTEAALDVVYNKLKASTTAAS